MQCYSLQNKIVNLHPKSFMRLTPGHNAVKITNVSGAVTG